LLRARCGGSSDFGQEIGSVCELPNFACLDRVPQVVVVQRHLDTSGRAIRVMGERVVRRIHGSNDILAWARSGAAL
jgi:hypothetical protein